jgi:hypothetical protein
VVRPRAASTFGIQDIGGDDGGERLGDLHVVVVERSRRIAVEIERSELAGW